VSHGVVIALELVGAVLILAGFTLAQLRLLDQHSLVYLVLNLVGSFVLAVIALADERWGFLLLEGVWAIVSAISLANVALGGFGWEDSPPSESGGAAGRTRPGVPRRRQMLNLMWSTSPSWTT
jgi:hypothetical protein